MMYPDEQIEGEFNPVTPGAALGSVFMARLEMAAQISKFTESPIETIFGLAMVEKMREYSSSSKEWELIPQLEWRRYRIDWALRRPGKPDIFIECDGNEFHTKPGDVARDQVRDAAAASANIKVFRFTGAEIFADAARCAFQVLGEALG